MVLNTNDTEALSSVPKALLANCASCNGLIRWIEKKEYWDELFCNDAQKEPAKGSEREKTLLGISRWSLDCLGVRKNHRDFRYGWESSVFSASDKNNKKIGALCRLAPEIIANYEEEINVSHPEAMFHCYKKLLLKPDGEFGCDVDGQVDDRMSDLRLSEAVYTHNHRKFLREAIINFIASRKHDNGSMLLLDVGAGNGSVLEDAAAIAKKCGENPVLVAIDPSPVAREACKERLNRYSNNKVYIIDGCMEKPEDIHNRLTELNLPINKAFMMAKAALHDRCLGNKEIKHLQELDDVSQSKREERGYIYRDENWCRVEKSRVINDMITILNRWHSCFPCVNIAIMEAHVVNSTLMSTYNSQIPLLPSYLAHSLSAQYLLTAEDHQLCLELSEYRVSRFIPMQVLGQKEALMSLAVIEQ